MDFEFKKEKRATLLERVLLQLREAIRQGKLKPGDRVIEAELARDMGISRITIREAIRYLEKEGLVTTTPYKGAVVMEVNEQDLKEIYELRLALEVLAIRLVIDNLDQEKIRRLEEVVDEMKRVAKVGSIDDVIEVDLQFHRAICELSGNHRLLESWANLSHQLRAFIATDGRLYGNDTPDKTLMAHYPVLDAIKASDTDRAAAIMKDVIDFGYQNAVKYQKEILQSMESESKNDKPTRRKNNA